MKKFYTFTLILLASIGLNAQVTISGFTFPGGVEEPFNANIGLDNNLSYDIRMEDNDGVDEYTMTLMEGVDGTGDSAAASANWDNGANFKLMSIKVKAADYGHFTVSSQMRSDVDNPGPAHWKVMWRHSGGDWADVPDSEFTLSTDWTTGVLVDIPVPEAANNPESSLYFAWYPTDNLDIDGNEVTATGTVLIDNIMIYGYENTSIEEINLEANTKCYPNPASSQLNIAVDEKAVSLSAFDISGRKIWENNNPQELNTLDVSGFSTGMYIVCVEYPTHKVNRKFSVK